MSHAVVLISTVRSIPQNRQMILGQGYNKVDDPILHMTILGRSVFSSFLSPNAHVHAHTTHLSDNTAYKIKISVQAHRPETFFFFGYYKNSFNIDSIGSNKEIVLARKNQEDCNSKEDFHIHLCLHFHSYNLK